MRQGNLSCIRLIATIMIISCHILQGLDLEAAFWVNLGVQIFFILSGYLYSRKKITNVKDFYYKQYIKIIAPYLLLCIFVLASNTFNGFKEINKFTTIGDLLGFQYWIGTIRNMSHTWFISYILLCYLITPLLQKIIKKESLKKSFSQLFIFIVLLQLFDSYNVININVSYIMLYMFGYYYGNMEKNFKNDYKIISFFIIITIIFFPIRILVQYYNNANIIKYIDYFNIGIGDFTSYHHALCGIVLFLIMKNIFKKVKHNKVLELSDKYSYYIYLVHQLFILNDYSFLNKTNSLFLNIIIIIILTLVSAIVLHYITNKINYLIKKINEKNKKDIKITK